MKPELINQEILLLTTSRFSRKQFCERDAQPGEPSRGIVSEQLEKACWNGLLRDILPDIIKSENKLFLWQVENHESFLHISLGLQPPVMENFFTLYPDFFLRNRQMN